MARGTIAGRWQNMPRPIPRANKARAKAAPPRKKPRPSRGTLNGAAAYTHLRNRGSHCQADSEPKTRPEQRLFFGSDHKFWRQRFGETFSESVWIAGGTGS